MRVSTDGQTTEPQRLELEQVAAARGWQVEVFEDRAASGATTARDGLDRLREGIRRGRIKVVLCAKLDRLGRSLPHLCQIVAEIDAAGCALVVPSQGIDTSQTNPAARLQLNVLAAVAELERAIISERTRAGLAVARRRGRHPGRPKFRPAPARLAVLREALAKGPVSCRRAAEILGCSRAVAQGVLSGVGG